MRTYHIQEPDLIIKKQVQATLDGLSKPIGSLGKLEGVARKIATIQKTLTPTLTHPHHLIFVGDNGISDEQISPSPKEITWQQAMNIMQGGAGINVFVRQHHFDLVVIDAGTDHDFPTDMGIIDRKIRRGTRNFLHEAALLPDEVNLALQYGEEVVNLIDHHGCNVVSMGELGVGSTAAASMWMSLLTSIPLPQCSGYAFGGKYSDHKLHVLTDALKRFVLPVTPMNVMSEFGSLELIMATGAMLRAAELNMAILIDGFLMSTAFLMAYKINPDIEHYAIFCQRSEDKGHRQLLEYLGVEPLLHLNFYVGEGSGAVCAYPLIQSAVNLLTQMSRFDETFTQRTRYDLNDPAIDA
ncbi:nicotinate-nucleotide--dimethylbenzimidazole phosphoribosyltransferase [Wohlfahrtiimonas chitiniclastica]|uniref:nicotinate-nucleotide--dimethylbenzimidazole phosphoribosyltransferase n=1 Tax=Wohlfahrtiimonas chitiniclastica TaxID=400946 RepID=UPI0021570907|nr:nicotinate-nucleotide--dimethylbenzimidazole phosphoribosyltransferase [Wohlfahrtiimonas chitiniclastica]MDC7252471.1 nicotinate-nucleotide--dimethylbenzimidazole phosphoribosyltransferase [Wohlfahrtiimonas chitiniclastica]